MLSVELIKKVFDDFDIEGYDFQEILEMIYIFDQMNVDDIILKRLNRFYRDFLQKIIEGINKKARQSLQKFTVITNHCYIIVYDWEKKGNASHFGLEDMTTIEAKEQAIKYIMGQL